VGYDVAVGGFKAKEGRTANFDSSCRLRRYQVNSVGEYEHYASGSLCEYYVFLSQPILNGWECLGVAVEQFIIRLPLFFVTCCRVKSRYR
jgi:20S proteasome alpha/beta subunit